MLHSKGSVQALRGAGSPLPLARLCLAGRAPAPPPQGAEHRWEIPAPASAGNPSRWGFEGCQGAGEGVEGECPSLMQGVTMPPTWVPCDSRGIHHVLLGAGVGAAAW